MPTDPREITLINKNNIFLGYKNVVEGHKTPVPLHRASSVVIFNGEKILLQKRSKQKFTWPEFWTNTCCTNVYRGETFVSSAKRSLKNEMGIDTELTRKYRFVYRARYDDIYGEHELDTVYFGEYSGQVKPNPKEAADFDWMNIPDIKKDLVKNPDKYTPWFKIIITRLFND
jgi:isopentenyl-diphosphate Delta-isomerase